MKRRELLKLTHVLLIPPNWFRTQNFGPLSCNIFYNGRLIFFWWWLRLLRLVGAPLLNLIVHTDLPDNFSGSVRSVWVCVDLHGQKYTLTLDQIFNYGLLVRIPALPYQADFWLERCWSVLVRNLPWIFVLADQLYKILYIGMGVFHWTRKKLSFFTL